MERDEMTTKATLPMVRPEPEPLETQIVYLDDTPESPTAIARTWRTEDGMRCTKCSDCKASHCGQPWGDQIALCLVVVPWRVSRQEAPLFRVDPLTDVGGRDCRPDARTAAIA